MLRDYKFFIPTPKLLLKTFRPNFDFSKLIFSRSSLLPIDFLGKKAFVHEGHGARFVFIKPEHLNQPIGAFIFTKRTGSKIHISKGKRDKKKLIFYYYDY